jgi:hypothetical protein
LIAQGVGGIGDAFSAAGGKSSNFQDQAAGIASKNTENRIGAMDTQRGQKLQDLQGNQEAQLADPKSPLSRHIIASARAAGMNVGSLMPGNMVLKMMDSMGKFALEKATIAQTGEHYKAEEANYGAQRDLEGKKINATVANENAGRTQAAARTLSEQGPVQRITNMFPWTRSPENQVLRDTAAGGGQAAPAQAPMGQTVTHPSGAKITRIN